MNNSPGDPVFFLHHFFIDRLWWNWQLESKNRLKEVDGNTIKANCIDRANNTIEGSIKVFKDVGNNVTLNDIIWMMYLYPAVTIEEVMDINSDHVCLEYI